MRSFDDILDDIYGTLEQIARDAKEPRIGTREIELARGSAMERKLAFAALKKLRAEGKIQRSNGYCWIHPDIFKQKGFGDA